MGFVTQSVKQDFPFSVDTVFSNLKEAVLLAGMTLTHADDLLKRVSVSVKLSWFSWGENLAIVVTEPEPGRATVEIHSSLKLGGNFVGAHKHQKNFDKIIYALSDLLQGKVSAPGREEINRDYTFVNDGALVSEQVKAFALDLRKRMPRENCFRVMAEFSSVINNYKAAMPARLGNKFENLLEDYLTTY